MPRFTEADKLKRHLKAAADALQREVLVTSQLELGNEAVSPYDTGRFRSSWFAAEGSSSNEVAPEGADAPNTNAKGLRTDSRKTYHLTNNLPYAQPVAIEGRVVSQPKTWFTEFRNQRTPQIQEAAARVIKQRFEL